MEETSEGPGKLRPSPAPRLQPAEPFVLPPWKFSPVQGGGAVTWVPPKLLPSRRAALARLFWGLNGKMRNWGRIWQEKSWRRGGWGWGLRQGGAGANGEGVTQLWRAKDLENDKVLVQQRAVVV